MRIQHNFHSIPKAFELVTGRRISPATACRYALRGVGPSESPIRLRTQRHGIRRVTTVAWVEDFIEARTAAELPELPSDRAEVSKDLARELA